MYACDVVARVFVCHIACGAKVDLTRRSVIHAHVARDVTADVIVVLVGSFLHGLFHWEAYLCYWAAYWYCSHFPDSLVIVIVIVMIIAIITINLHAVMITFSFVIVIIIVTTTTPFIIILVASFIIVVILLLIHYFLCLVIIIRKDCLFGWGFSRSCFPVEIPRAD